MGNESGNSTCRGVPREKMRKCGLPWTAFSWWTESEKKKRRFKSPALDFLEIQHRDQITRNNG